MNRCAQICPALYIVTGGEFHLDFPSEIPLRQRVSINGISQLDGSRPVDWSQDGDERLQMTRCRKQQPITTDIDNTWAQVRGNYFPTARSKKNKFYHVKWYVDFQPTPWNRADC